jgi:succinate dehydrogenase / fumarate reductase membrane anchor subunit
VNIGGRAYPITDHTFDVVVVGAGGSGLRAALGATRMEVMQSISHPVVALLLIIGLASAFWHMRLGLQVVIEDYLHSHLLKFTALALNIAVATALFAVAAFSILKMSFAV